MNETYDELARARDRLDETGVAVQQALEQAEFLCGYESAPGFVIDPLVPGEPDFPAGSPTCLESLAQWWDAYLDYLPVWYEVEDLEAATAQKVKAWLECVHEHPDIEAA